MKAKTARRFSDVLDFFRSVRRVITNGEHEIKLVKKEIRRCLKQGEYYALYKMPDWKHELYKVTEEYFENQGYKIRYVKHNNVEICWVDNSMTNKITWFKDEQGIDRVKVQDAEPLNEQEAIHRYSECNFTMKHTKTDCIQFIDKLMSIRPECADELRCIRFYLNCARGYFPDHQFMNLLEGDEFPYEGQRVFATDCYGKVYDTIYKPSKDGTWSIHDSTIITWMPHPGIYDEIGDDYNNIRLKDNYE